MRHAAAVVIWLMLAGGALAQEPATPPEPAVTWGGEGDFTSRYVWRGIAYSDGRVSWPSAWVAARGFTFTFWANIDPRTAPSFNRYDLSVDYERAIGKLTLTGTYVRYGIRAGEDSYATTELIARTSYTAGPGDVYVLQAIDVDAKRGAYYVETGYSIEHEFNANSTLAVDASLGFWPKTFAEKYVGLSGRSAVGPVSVNVALTRRLTPYLSVRPHAGLSRVLDSEGRALAAAPTGTFGVALVLGR